MSAPQNPPAYPSVEIGGPNQDWPVHHHGMSLRDWFAGKAIAGMTADSRLLEIYADNATKHQPMQRAMATDAYRIADAMLAVREQSA